MTNNPQRSVSSGRIYKVVVSCGTAIATSTVVSMKVKELLTERGLKIHTIQCRVVEVPMLAPDADIIISTAQVPFDINIPVVDGLPFLTGIGVKEVIDKIVSLLQE